MPSLFSVGKSKGRTNSIDDLKSVVTKHQGFATPTLYNVMLPSLSSLGVGGTASDGRELNLLCSSVQLPGRQIMSQERAIGGIFQKVANNSATADVYMTFKVLNNYGVKEYFDVWQNSAIEQGDLNSGQGPQLKYAKEYQHQVKIQQLKKGFGIPIYNKQIPMPSIIPSEIKNRLPKIDILGGALGSIDLAQGEIDIDFASGDQVIYECTLVDAYPTTVNALTLTDAGGNSILEFSMQLSYRRWFRTDAGTGNMDALESIVSTISKIF